MIKQITTILGVTLFLFLAMFFVLPKETHAFNGSGICPSGSISGDFIIGNAQTLTGQSNGAGTCPNPVTLTVQAIASNGTSCDNNGGLLGTVGSWTFGSSSQSSFQFTPTYAAPPVYQTPDGGTCYKLTDGGTFWDFYIFHPGSATATPIPTAQPVPEAFHLDASCASSTQINLTWGSSSGATSYNVYQRVPPGTGTTTLVASTTTTSYSVSGLTPGTAYEFGILAINSSGSTWNDNASFPVVTCSVPPTPTSVIPTCPPPPPPGLPPTLNQMVSVGSTNYGIPQRSGPSQLQEFDIYLTVKPGSSRVNHFGIAFGNPGPNLKYDDGVISGSIPNVSVTSCGYNEYAAYACWHVRFDPAFGTHNMSTAATARDAAGLSASGSLSQVDSDFNGQVQISAVDACL